jgi:hypothetical protein
MCFTAAWCVWVGRYMYWHTRLTANTTSGLDRERYWSAPAVLLNNVGLSKVSPSNLLSGHEATIEDVAGLARSMLLRLRMLYM